MRLLNARKKGLFSDLPQSRRTSFPDDDYRFASEVAARFLEQREGLSLDSIMCDPALAAEFDRLAADIAPGFDSLRYRWAALKLRKCRRLAPELISRVVPPAGIQLGRLNEVDVTKIPSEQGVYIFYALTETLYVGEAQSLRRRVAKHLDHSDNKCLARWFWEYGIDEVRLEVRALPAATLQRIRKAVEAELIRSRRPRFNIQRP